MKSLKHLIKKCPKCGKKGMRKVYQKTDGQVVLKKEVKKLSFKAMFRYKRNKDEEGNEKPLRIARARGCSSRERFKKVSGNSKYKIIFKCEHKDCLEAQEFVGNSYAKVAAEVRNNL